MGFPLLRNPFCVVHPMEDGATIFSARLLDVRQYGNNDHPFSHPLTYLLAFLPTPSRPHANTHRTTHSPTPTSILCNNPGNNERIIGGMLIDDLRLHYRFSPEVDPYNSPHQSLSFVFPSSNSVITILYSVVYFGSFIHMKCRARSLVS